MLHPQHHNLVFSSLAAASMSLSAQPPLPLKPPNLHRPNLSYYTLFSPIPFKPFSTQIPYPTLPHRPRHPIQIQLSTSDDYTPPPPSTSPQTKPFSATEAFNKLKRYGSCGILAYGILNTAYYMTTFLVVWFYVAPASGRFGYVAAVKRFVKVMAMVWAGSQVTKVARAAGAVALAPFVEKGLTWCSAKFKFRSRAVAYMVVVGVCVGMALVVFLAVTVMSA